MNCDVKEIQYWLGHANIETTLQIYTHISKLREKATATNLNGIFKLTGRDIETEVRKSGDLAGI